MGVLLPDLLWELPTNSPLLGLSLLTLVTAYFIYIYIQRQHKHQVRY